MSEINNSSPVPRQDLEAIAVRVRNAHAGVVHATANLLDHAMTAGAALIEAQLQVPDGEWVSWLEKHCDFRLRTAQVYMQLARRRSDLEGQHTAPRSLRGALAALNRSDRALRPPIERRRRRSHGWCSIRSPGRAPRPKSAPISLMGLATPGCSPRFRRSGTSKATPYARSLPSERRMSAHLLNKYQAVRRAIGRALGSTQSHAGPTLDLEAVPVTDTAMATH